MTSLLSAIYIQQRCERRPPLFPPSGADEKKKNWLRQDKMCRLTVSDWVRLNKPVDSNRPHFHLLFHMHRPRPYTFICCQSKRETKLVDSQSQFDQTVKKMGAADWQHATRVKWIVPLNNVWTGRGRIPAQKSHRARIQINHSIQLFLHVDGWQTNDTSGVQKLADKITCHK